MKVFDQQAAQYKAVRPDYPGDLFKFLASQTSRHYLAVDVGAGTGQATLPLSRHYKRVVGIEPGAQLIANASQAPNIRYLLSSASRLPLIPNCANLIGVAAAAHWFDLDAFYAEVDRVLKPGGTLAIWAYYFIPEVSPEIDAFMEKFMEKMKPYGDPKLGYVFNKYSNLPFPYDFERKAFKYSIKADLNRYIALVESMSLVKNCMEATGKNPIDDIRDELTKLWGDASQERRMTWTNNMLVGKKPDFGAKRVQKTPTPAQQAR
jgi:SAM-dependent methyltransferase